MYISKTVLLNCFKTLGELDAGNQQQGLTKKVSAIRYFFALDAFCKNNGEACLDASDASEKKDFSDFVSAVVRVNDKNYTPDFIGIKADNGDCSTGNNFYGGGPVLKSKSSNKTFLYPARMGEGKDLLSVKHRMVTFSPNGYDHIQSYFPSEESKAALWLWLARNYEGFSAEDNIASDLTEFASSNYSDKLINATFPSSECIISFLGEIAERLLEEQPPVFLDADFNEAAEQLEIAFLDDQLQKISYGAPGTGKSKNIDDVASALPDEDVIRTTFHPDSDYSTFVGAYKPYMERIQRVVYVNDGKTAQLVEGPDELKFEKKIAYEFVPQAFARAYVRAWKNMAAGAQGTVDPVMLVIEEINRGDCAKIFGDLFQLLDRRVKDGGAEAWKKTGFSEYPVLADSDFADYIRESLTDEERKAIAANYPCVVAEENLELILPPNMYIWATMNTSDQSLFPMDSAFKRRWDWKYVPIKDHPEENWKIDIGAGYDWGDFLKKVNAEVLTRTSSEDKQLGYFFVKTPNKTISADTFVNKVLFFLWNMVWKDCYNECEYLKNGDTYFTFNDFFDDKGGANVTNIEKVLGKDGLDVAGWKDSAESAPVSAA